MDKYSKLASNTIILAFGQFGSKLIVIVMMRFYTWLLGSAGYGSVGNIVDASNLLMAIVTLSIGESVIRYGIDKKYDNKQVFSVGLSTVLVGLVVFLPLVPLLGLVSMISDYIWLIYIYVFTGSVKSVCALYVRSTGRVRLYAVDGIFTTVVNLLLNLILLWGLNLGVVGYVLSVVIADAASIVFLFIMADLPKSIQFLGIDKGLRRSMLRFSVPMIPTTVMWWVTNVSDGFFITGMMGESYTGVYKAAYRLPNMISLVSGIFSQAWNMSAISEKNSRTIAKFYTDVFNFYQSIIYVLAAGILLVVKPLLKLMANGEGFVDVHIYTPFLILAVIFTCFSTFMGSIYVASKKSKRSMITTSTGAILNLILNYLTIPVFGINGAALSTLVSYIVIFIIRVIDTRKIVLMDFKPVKMVTNLVVILAMCLIVFLVKNNFVYSISLSVLFLIVVVLNYRAGIQAISYIRNVIKSKKPD